MSHVTTIEVSDTYDIPSLKQMCKDMGWEFLEGKQNYVWYGSHMGDYPIPEGFTKEQMGSCEHAIKIPGANYEIGVARNNKGELKLLWDFWGSGGLQQKLGKDAGLLKQAYTIAKGKVSARKHGHFFKTIKSPRGDAWKRLLVEV